jgi:hypothetical protein
MVAAKIADEEGNLENLLERVAQMNMGYHRRNATTTSEPTTNPSSQLMNKINIKLQEYNGTSNENVVTWLISLEEMMINRFVYKVMDELTQVMMFINDLSANSRSCYT